MSDLISRGKLLGVIKPMVGIWYDETFWIDYKRVIDIIENLSSAEPEPEDFEWCHDCKEYDQDKHCCHRWTKVIMNTLEEIKTKWGWIPFTEALPEEEEEVLVTVRFDGTKDVKPSVYVETASQISGSWFSYSDEWKVSQNRHHVIAWMPLPEGYRGE